jgi:hypothetical protein
MKKEEHIESFKEKLMSQRKKLLNIAIIFITSFVIIMGIYIYDIKQESDAKELEAEAYRYYFGLIKNTELSQDQRFLKSAELFIKAYEKKKNLSYLLNAGYAYDMAQQKEKSLEILNKVVKSGDPNFSNLAKVKIAMIHLKYNEQDLTEKYLMDIINGKSDTLKDFAMFQLAKIYEKDKRQEAMKYYKMIVDKYPNSPFASIAKKFLENEKRK